MNVFKRLHDFSRKKTPWLGLLAVSMLPFILALVFQHFLGMLPCVLCIYQRVALLGIAFSALLVLLAPTCRFLRALGFVAWGYSAFKGLLVAWEQTQRYLNPSQFTTCAFKVNFPEWLPLDSWLPQVFRAYTACEPFDWSLLGLKLPQWMVFMFATHLAVVSVTAFTNVIGWKWNAEYLCNQK